MKSSHGVLQICAAWAAIALLLSASPGFAAPTDPQAFAPEESLESIQAKIEHNGYSFTVASNWVYNLSPAQKAQLLSRHAPASPSPDMGKQGIGPLASYLGRKALEAQFSWLDYNGHTYLGPVRDQGACGSCYSFGAAAAAEGTYNLAHGLFDDQCMDFSESFIAFCLSRTLPYSNHFDGCYGADWEYSELQALVDPGMGVPLESVFPYTGVDPGYCNDAYWNEPRFTFDGWYRVPCSDIEAIKTAIRVFGVVDAAVYVTAAFEAYSSGVFEDTNTTCPDGAYTPTNHAIALVGWDDNPPEGGGGCWILRNSWGEYWGEAGYMRIRYTSAAVACEVAYLDPGATTPSAPVASSANPTSVMTTSATLNGTVMPRGAETSYYFEYGPTETYGQTTPVVSAGSAFGAVAVSAPIAGLTPFTIYHFRLVASNSYGESLGADKIVVTLFETPVLATAVTSPSTNLFQRRATLQGSFTPNYSSTIAYFEYGPTAAYGDIITALDASGNPASGNGVTPIPVSAPLTGLTPGTVYHYRLTAVNSAGMAHGPDQTLTTQRAGEYLQEDFEHSGALPPGWTTQVLAGGWNWQFMMGGPVGYPSDALSGSYNAVFFADDYADFRTRLISPNFDLSGAVQPILRFGLYMEGWWGDQDTLSVLFRPSPSASWTTLATFNQSIDRWTAEAVELPLPVGSTNSAIAFSGDANYGYGICIDDVAISGTPQPLTVEICSSAIWQEEGKPVTVVATAHHAVGEVLYTWEKDGQVVLASAAPVYCIGALAASHEGSYRCRIKDGMGTEALSNSIYLQVVAPNSVPATGTGGLVLLAGALVAVAWAVRKSASPGR